MRWLVCGGRDFSDVNKHVRGGPSWLKALQEYKFVVRKLHQLAEQYSIKYTPDDNWLPTDIVIISGAAKGVDSSAADWAVANYAQLEEYPADWKKFGKKAGYIRNQQMLDEGKPDLVIAFPGGRGTAMMVQIAKAAGVPVVEIPFTGATTEIL